MTDPTRAEEAQAYTLSLIRGMTFPATTMTWALASAQIAAPRISQALKALVRRRVIRAESYRFMGATYWRIDALNPETEWKPR